MSGAKCPKLEPKLVGWLKGISGEYQRQNIPEFERRSVQVIME
jgi:hypothetical protein